MPDTNAIQPIELIPAPTAKPAPAVKAAPKVDPAKELKALKIECTRLAEDNKRFAELVDDLTSEVEGYRKKLGYIRSYQRATMTNIVDQLTVLQRTAQILMAGGEE